MLYFLPDCNGADLANLDKAGLAGLHRADDRAPLMIDLESPGPGGLPGQLVTWNDDPVYLPESQTWFQSRQGSYWYGWNGQPSPESLRRSHQVGGAVWLMGDGQDWMLPKAANLPQTIDLDAEGKLIRVPTALTKSFAPKAAEALAACLDFARNQTGKFPWSIEQRFSYLCEALAVNYRLVPDVIARLGLILDDQIFRLIANTTDTAQIQQALADAQNAA